MNLEIGTTIVDGVTINTKVVSGYQIASGAAEDNPYPLGSIEMQIPFFKERGLDLSSFYKGTLNLDIAPYNFKIISPSFIYEKIKWVDGFPAESFSFVACEVCFKNKRYEGFIYYPHPDTKIGHFQNSSVIEIITHHIPAVSIGCEVELKVSNTQFQLIC